MISLFNKFILFYFLNKNNSLYEPDFYVLKHMYYLDISICKNNDDVMSASYLKNQID